MADETYRLIYEAVDRASRVIDGLIAKTAKLDAAVDRSNAKLRTLGADTAGVTKMTSALVRLDAELKSKVTDAAAAEKALKGVGAGNAAVARLTKRLKDLEEQLKRVTTAGAGATAATGEVGAGSVPGAGNKAGGGGGRGGVPGGYLTAGLGRHLAYAAFRKVSSAAGDSIGDRRQHFAESADMASEYRKDLGELAVLQGKNGADEDLIRQDLAFQKKTLLNPETSRTFRLEFGGAIDPALKSVGADGKPNIDRKTADELEVEAAKFTNRYGLDPTTGGRMAGLLGVTHKVKDAKSGLGIMAETMEQLNVAGVGPVKTMASQLLSLSGGMLDKVNPDSEDDEAGGGGRFASFPAMAARFAATTVSQAGSAARAKTRIVQSDRLLRKLAYDNESELGRKAKIDPQDDYETAIRKLEVATRGTDADKMMKDSKYGNSTERLAAIEAMKLNGIVDQNLKDPRTKARAASAAADNDSYAGTILGRQQAAENDEFAARIETGLAGERLKAARTAEKAKMIRSDTLKSGVLGRFADMGASATTLGGISGEDLRVDTQVFRSLQERGERVGVDVEGSHPNLSFGRRAIFGQDEKMLATEFDAASREVEAAEKIKQGAALLVQGANALGKQQRPAPPPPGNGGAGFNPGRP